MGDGVMTLTVLNLAHLLLVSVLAFLVTSSVGKLGKKRLLLVDWQYDTI